MRVITHVGRLTAAAVLVACLQGCAPTGSVKNRVITPHYDIRIDAQAPNTARVTLTLPHFDPLDPAVPRLISTGEQTGTHLQLHDIRCDGKPLKTSGRGQWDLPLTCKTASWTMDFKAVGPEGIVASKRQSLHLKTPKDWWIISGPSSLLRLQPAPERVDVVIAAPNRQLVLESMPGLKLPPAYFVVGDAPSHTVKTNGLSLTYIADDLKRIETTVHVADHMRGLDYFRRILNSANYGDIPKDLTVVWLGIARNKGESGGAAGYDTLLVNYIKSGGPPQKRDLLLPLATVLHEQFHQLTRGNLPAWVNESLANYYAFKALGRIYPDQADVAAARAAFLRPNAKIDLGLIDVQRRIEKDHDFSKYSLFYTQGAAFWQAVNQALVKATNGGKSLDDVLPAIMTSSYSDDVVLPPHVEDALSAIPKAELNALVAKYLKGVHG